MENNRVYAMNRRERKYFFQKDINSHVTLYTCRMMNRIFFCFLHISVMRTLHNNYHDLLRSEKEKNYCNDNDKQANTGESSHFNLC